MFYANMMSFMAALLERKDRISMAAGLEVRVPFADHRLVEYAWNIPWEMKNEGGVEKSILRRALKDVLPEAVLYRKKTPYPKTHHPVYAENVSALLRQAIQPGSPLLEIFSCNALLELAQSRGASYRHPWYGQLMQGPQLMAYLVQVNRWLTEYNIDVTGN